MILKVFIQTYVKIMSLYKTQIEEIWEKNNHMPDMNIIDNVISLLEAGTIRVAEKVDNIWHVNEWIKKAILLKLKFSEPHIISGGDISWYDKILPKFDENSTSETFSALGTRIVPGAFIRKGSYIGPRTVIMPSFINIGAHIGEGTMIDTWATVGSCAQIGKNCHISGGTGIGGVLEPLQANPVIIEDNCFIGARSEIAEGVIVKEGAVISMGVFIAASTKIINRATGDISYGTVPPYSVVVPGNIRDKTNPDISTYAAIIVKTVDEKTRSKTSINELLRG